LDILADALSVSGLILMLYALTAEKWSHSTVSLLFSSLLVGLSLAERTDPKVGLAVVLIYSGGLTALTYASTALLSRREGSISISRRIFSIVLFPAMASLLFLAALRKSSPLAAVPCFPARAVAASPQDALALAAVFVMAVSVILVLFRGAEQ